jgi:integrase
VGGQIGKLSAIQAATLVRKRVVGMHNDGGGLYLEISPGNGSSWIFRFKRGGRRTARDMGLGSTDTITLAEARAKARECRKLLLEGRDPIEEKRAVRASRQLEMSFQECAVGYLAANEGSWKNPKHRQQWRNTLATYVYPVIGNLPVQRVDEAGIVKVLMPIWHEKAETARRVRMRIETVIEWAIASKFFVGDNPAKRERLKHLLGAQGDVVTHHAAVSYAEIGHFIAKLRKWGGIGALPLELCILTGTRVGEVRGADWEEFDRQTRTWTIPGPRRKGRRGKEMPLTVPLSGRCIEILDEMAERIDGEAGLIFPADDGGQLSVNTLNDTVKQLGYDATAHGMRSTFRDWCGDQTNFSREVCEAALGHKTGSEVELAYRRGSALEKRRRLMEAWSKYCGTPALPDNGKVVAIRAVAQ